MPTASRLTTTPAASGVMPRTCCAIGEAWPMTIMPERVPAMNKRPSTANSGVRIMRFQSRSPRVPTPATGRPGRVPAGRCVAGRCRADHPREGGDGAEEGHAHDAQGPGEVEAVDEVDGKRRPHDRAEPVARREYPGREAAPVREVPDEVAHGRARIDHAHPEAGQRGEPVHRAQDWTDPRHAIPAPKRAAPRRMSVRACTYCCVLPATIEATAPMVMRAVNVSERRPRTSRSRPPWASAARSKRSRSRRRGRPARAGQRPPALRVARHDRAVSLGRGALSRVRDLLGRQVAGSACAP